MYTLVQIIATPLSRLHGISTGVAKFLGVHFVTSDFQLTSMNAQANIASYNA